MYFDKVSAVYFSPNGSTAGLCRTVANELAANIGAKYFEYDFTLPKMRHALPEFTASTLALFAAPVYAGRIPNLLLPYIQGFSGNGGAAVPILIYGGRDYDFAPTEWKRLLIKNGFFVPAAAAFVAQHSFARSLSSNRPDENDLTFAKIFAAELAALCRKWTGSEEVALPHDGEELLYYKPTDSAGSPMNFLKAKPAVSFACNGCGICAALCPMGAIERNEPRTHNAPCIKCSACINACPQNARCFDDPSFIAHREYLENNFKERKTPSVWKA